MKTNLLNKFWLRVWMLVAVMTTALAGTAWADSVTFTAGTDTGETSVTKGDVTATMTTMSNASYYQIYANQSGTFSCSNGNITKIEFTCTASGTAKYGPGNASATPGTYSYNEYVGTWTGSAETVTISTTAQIRMTSLTITYTPNGGTTVETVATPTFSVEEGTYTSAQTVAISCTTSGATIYYTTDGSAPTTSSTVYSTPLTIEETTTVKAIAVKEGMDNSAVATATYTITSPYTGENYVRVYSLDALTDGAKVIIAARFNETQTNGYYAMSATTTGKPTGVIFGSETSDNGEILPAKIVNAEDTYCWTVGVTSDGYTFTNASNQTLGYSSSTNFATGGDNTEWVITRATAGTSAMVAGYEGFYITNKISSGRAIALNTYFNFGPYAVSNNNSNAYNFYLDIFVQGATPSADPIITASNVSIAYDATSGSIAYTISNEPSPAGTLTASTTSNWLTLGESTTSPIAFTCTANEEASERTAIVTLTYTYGSESVTKDVTVTQAGSPNIINNISDITAAGTYTVVGTIVAKSKRGFIVGDGTGYVYYYNTSYVQDDYDIGDDVKLSGPVVVYGGVFEFNNTTTVTFADGSNYTKDVPTVLTGADMDARVASTSPAQLSSYVEYEGTLTVDDTHYNITGITSATKAIGSISFPISTAFTSLAGKKVKVTGYYVGISSSTYYNTLIGSVEEVVVTEPTIDVSTTLVEAPAEATEGTITVTYNNIPSIVPAIEFYDENGNVVDEDTYDWLFVGIDTDTNNLRYYIDANTSSEARTAYLKIYDQVADVYSDLITFTQAGYVAEFATLPFEFDGGKADIEATEGLTQEGLGNDYSSSPKLKFDSTGDCLVLKFDERPGKLTFDIKGNSFSEGTFKVQTSEDGTTYTDLATYIELGATQGESFSNLGEDVRYIKWVYTEKVTGNVALGNIHLDEYSDVAENYLLTIANPDNVTITAAFGEEVLTNDNEAEVAEGTEVTVALSIADGYVFESLTVTGEEEGQTVTPTEANGVWTFLMPAYNVTVNATAVEDEQPEGSAYVLATTVTPGKTYLITAEDVDKIVVMSKQQNNNNRAATDEILLVGTTLYGDANGSICEFVIEKDGDFYTIYDPENEGYLYAASSSANYLRTQPEVDENARWSIEIAEDGVATIKAQGDNTRKWMRYNSVNKIFSCYTETSTTQKDIKLYEKVEAITPTAQTITVTDAGYATMVAEANLLVPADVEGAYTATINGNYAILTSVDAIPAGAAVIVKADAGSYDFAYTDDDVDALTGNDLVAATEDVTANGSQYVLANGAKGVGFYQAETGTTIPAGKAYLVVTSGVKAFYGFEEDDATSIETVDNGQQTTEGAIFNLAGQRMGKMQNGVNIVNGKKILR